MSAEDGRTLSMQQRLLEPVSIEVEGFDGKPVVLTGVTFWDIQAQMFRQGLHLVEPAKRIAQAINRGLESASADS